MGIAVITAPETAGSCLRTPEYEVPVGLFLCPIRAEYYCATTRSIARRSGLLWQGEVLSRDWSCAGVDVTEETSYRAGGWGAPAHPDCAKLAP